MNNLVCNRCGHGWTRRKKRLPVECPNCCSRLWAKERKTPGGRLLTQVVLKELLHYNPKSGVFKWREGRKGARKSLVAGTTDACGYVQICVEGTHYKAHRLAFLYMKGYFPEHQVDHKYGIRDDNRWAELQHATKFCNMQNCVKNRRNTSGYPGVTWSKRGGKWVAQAGLNLKVRGLGYHETKLDAALARLTFEVQCPQWKCNYQGELIKAIKKAWPEFNERSLN